jgi:hypothetical protein
VQAQKNQLRSQLDGASKARESARLSMKELRGSMKFTKGEAFPSSASSLAECVMMDAVGLV